MGLHLKKVTSIALVFLLLASVFCTSAAAVGNNEGNFSGSRTVEFTVDWSDLDIAVNGSRPAFDLILRKSAPEWLVYSLSATGRDLILSMYFNFVSFEDYYEKISELLCYSPNVLYSDTEDFMLIEGNRSIELLNFLEYALEEQNCLNGESLSELLVLSRNEIFLDDNLYTGNDRIEIRQPENVVVKFSNLTINTRWNEDGSLTRSIEVRFDPEMTAEEDKLSIKRRFKSVEGAEVTDNLDENNVLSVTFQALSETQLSLDTMLCLDTATNISYKYRAADAKTVTVERAEYIDFSGLLNDDADFYYNFDFPSYIDTLKTDDQDIDVYNKHLSARNLDEISCSYNTPPFFTYIELTTDMSNVFGKISETVLLELPLELASQFHESIKEQLASKLTDGSVLDIYDETGHRCYKISFSSYSAKDIEEFKVSFLGRWNRINYSDSWIPFGQSSIREIFDLGHLPFSETPLGEIRASYKASELIRTDGLPYGAGDTGEISYHIKDGSTVLFEYRRLNVLKLMVEISVPLLLIAVMCISSIKRKRAKPFEQSKSVSPHGGSEPVAVQYRKYGRQRQKHGFLIAILIFLCILILAATALFVLEYFEIYKIPMPESLLQNDLKTLAEKLMADSGSLVLMLLGIG